MPVVVQAVPADEFRRWIADQKATQLAAAASADKTWSRDELMAHGKEVYAKTCVACHQPDGKGMPPAFPALAGSAIVKGRYIDGDNRLVKDGHLDRVLNGRAGTAMQAFRETLSDADIAAVITYERNAFGNDTGDVLQPTLVRKMR